MKLSAAIPLLLSMIAFILTLLSLLAGYKPGFLEDYHLAALNTSNLGADAVAAIASGTTTSGGGGGIGSATGLLPPALQSEAASLLSGIGGGIANSVAESIGISEFYSLHVMNFCQGRFTPKPTAPNAEFKVSECTNPLDFEAYNLTGTISEQLRVGPFRLTLSDVGIRPDVQKQLNALPTYGRILAAVFMLSCLLTGICMLTAAVAMVVISGTDRKMMVVNWVFALLALIFLLVSALIATVGPVVAADQLRKENAGGVKLDVVSGDRLPAITWAAFALMLISMVYWSVELVKQKSRKRGLVSYGQERNSMGFTK